ncbi:MAG TPA: histidine kinase [Blastocatellia bacterium]|nr:histidine kinase [Blastocatellia bacterium]
MTHKFHDSSLACASDYESDVKASSASGATSLLMRQIASGAFLFILGTALGVFLASLPVRGRTPIGGSFPADFLHLLGLGSLTWYACLLSSPLYVWLARRFPIYQRRWWRNLALHFLITSALVMLTGVIYFRLLPKPASSVPDRAEKVDRPTAAAPNENIAAQSRRAEPGGPRGPDLAGFLLFRLLTESLPLWAMIALIHAFEFHRRYRRHEFEAARLQTQLGQSRLEALTAQLQPHFLFNTLQGISTLMHRDVGAADAMLSRLSDLLRQTLQHRDRQEAPLSEEIEMLDHYVEISRERFKDRWLFETQISPDARDALVPFFILQPLVENALQHGIARRAGIGRVTVSAKRQGETLQLNVTDDGPGLAEAERTFPREGVGLSNTRERLRELYGDRQSLTLEAPPSGGLRVEVVIPYKVAPAPDTREVTPGK